MTVDEFGGYMFLFIMCFAVIMFTIGFTIDGWDFHIAFLSYSIFGIGIILSIYIIVKEQR